LPQLLGIQYVRAIAALMVVVIHIANFFPIFGEDFRIGRFGVDLFFVVSGFVMWITARDMSPVRFALRRIVRVVPIYWIVTVFMSLYTFSGGFTFGFVTPAADIVRSMFFIPFANAQLMQYVMPVAEVGWTLNFEMLFYAIFALALFFRPGWRIPLVFAALCGVFLAGDFAGPDNPALGFYANTIVLEFVAGMCLGRLYQRGGIKPSLLALPLGLLIVVPALIVWNERTGIRFVDLGIAATAIVYATIAFEPWFRKRPSAHLLLLGDASYSIYLTHKIPLEFFLAASHKGLFPKYWMLSWPLALAICTVLAVLVYRLVERPMTVFLLSRLDGRVRRPIGATPEHLGRDGQAGK
jgi:exopolysaccharide production protein ExoZ